VNSFTPRSRRGIPERQGWRRNYGYTFAGRGKAEFGCAVVCPLCRRKTSIRRYRSKFCAAIRLTSPMGARSPVSASTALPGAIVAIRVTAASVWLECARRYRGALLRGQAQKLRPDRCRSCSGNDDHRRPHGAPCYSFPPARPRQMTASAGWEHHIGLSGVCRYGVVSAGIWT
jgi:hypothetical protein